MTDPSGYPTTSAKRLIYPIHQRHGNIVGGVVILQHVELGQVLLFAPVRGHHAHAIDVLRQVGGNAGVAPHDAPLGPSARVRKYWFML